MKKQLIRIKNGQISQLFNFLPFKFPNLRSIFELKGRSNYMKILNFSAKIKRD